MLSTERQPVDAKNATHQRLLLEKIRTYSFASRQGLVSTSLFLVFLSPASRSIRVRRPEPAAEEYTHARRISYTPSAACRSRTRSRKRIRCLPLEGDGPSTRGHHLVDRPFPENKSFRPPFRRRASRPSIINTPKVVSIQEQFLTTTAWLVEDLAKDHVGCILHF